MIRKKLKDKLSSRRGGVGSGDGLSKGLATRGAEHGPPYEWQVRVVHADRIAENEGELCLVIISIPPRDTLSLSIKPFFIY